MKVNVSDIVIKSFISIFIFSAVFLVKPVFQIFEYQIYDYRFQLREKLGNDPNISPYIVNIVLDDDTYRTSAKSYNWGRAEIAEVINKLSQFTASTIGCDMMFVNRLDNDKDSLLVKAIANSNCVILPYHMEKEDKNYYNSNEIEDLDSILKIDDMPEAQFEQFPNFEQPGVSSFNSALKNAKGLGFANYYLDEDGVARKIPLIGIYNSRYIPTFALAIVCDFLGYDFMLTKIIKNSIILKGETKDDIVIPIDEDGNFVINFYGSYIENNFLHSYKVRDILDLQQTKAVNTNVRGRVCILSDISLKSSDFVHVPSEARFPASYLFTTVISNIISEDFLNEIDSGVLFILIMLIIISILTIDYLFGILKFTLSVITLIIIYSAFNFGLFIHSNLILPYFIVIYPVMIISFIFFIMKIIQKEKLRIETENNLRKFLSPPAFSFHFIEDENFRKQMISRWNEARQGYEIGAFRSTMTMCGSIIEGLLCFALRKEKDKAFLMYKQKYKSNIDVPEIDRWKMYQLIDVSQKIEIISKDSRGFVHIVNTYRNLIHPDVEIRENVKVNKFKTTAIISLLAIVYEEIEDRI
ncbi:MAG: CHASE2 domain-containing protein [Candidatus Cloacimonetes bacterium]|nr:CHASE2 domain-containing protein [Candidatus Cloacimonadota bacterium]